MPPEFAPVGRLPIDEYRERVLEWARTLAAEGLTAPGFPTEFGGRGEFGANVAAFETYRTQLAAPISLSEPSGRASASPPATVPAGRP